MIDMDIKLDDLRGAAVAQLLEEHLVNMLQLSPRESVHALDLQALREPDITFWTAWSAGDLLGCGALKELDPCHGEIKSMRTAAAHLRKGVAANILAHMLAQARARKYQRLSLETGSQPAFLPARQLYRRFGFDVCGPFAGYREDPYSVFMTRQL